MTPVPELPDQGVGNSYGQVQPLEWQARRYRAFRHDRDEVGIGHDGCGDAVVSRMRFLLQLADVGQHEMLATEASGAIESALKRAHMVS